VTAASALCNPVAHSLFDDVIAWRKRREKKTAVEDRAKPSSTRSTGPELSVAK
jgi:hypothetical protein